MLNGIILVVLVMIVSLGFYSCYKDLTSERREKKAIKQALKDAGYV